MLTVPRGSILKVCALVLVAAWGQAGSTIPEGQALAAQRAPDPCDNPDANINCCFVNAPKALGKVLAIVGSRSEPGEKLLISGTVFKADGETPYPNVVLYAYQTDSKGRYSKTGTETGIQKWHGRLHGWCRTDQNGSYEIRTIRPARYPDNSMPAHIHAALQERADKQPYYISDFVFHDDSLVNAKYLKSITSLVGGSGIVNVTQSATGTWIGKRDITVGQ